MIEIRDTLYEILESGFTAYLAALTPPITCKLLKHGLDTVAKKDSTAFPHLVLDMKPDRIRGCVAGHLARGQDRNGKIDILIAVRCEKTYESYATATKQAEELMIDCVQYFESKADEIHAAGYSGLRYRDEDDNWGAYISTVAGVPCVVFRVALDSDYKWSQGDIYKNKTLTPRR